MKTDSEDQTQLVQMRLRPKTLEKLEKLSHLSGISNKTQVIANAIQFTELISETIHSGGKIYIEKDGKRELLTIVGI